MVIHSRLIRRSLAASFGAALVLVTTAVVLAQGGPPPQGAGEYYRVVLVVEDETFEEFIAVSGLDSETEVIEFREGADDTVRKLPGRTSYGDITLKRGLTGVDELWVWREAIADGEADSRDGSVIVFDRRGIEVARWNFSNGWPSKWEGPAHSEDGSGGLLEVITLTVEGLEKD